LRLDEPFISIKIIAEAALLVEKHIGNLSSKYTTHNGLDTALSIGMKELLVCCNKRERAV
jgi:hypothetical protein